MIISIDFLNQLSNSKIMKVYEVPAGYNVFEYAKAHYSEGTVFGSLQIENELVNALGDKVGYFGVDFNHNILAYYFLEGTLVYPMQE